METTGRRQGGDISYEVQVSKSTGKMVKVRCRSNTSAGCSADVSEEVAFTFMMRVDGGYTMQDFDGEARLWRTNSPTSTAMRGFGGPEGQYFAEVLMEHIAHALDMDPVTVREANMTKEGDMLHYGSFRMSGMRLHECWRELLKRSNFHQRKKLVLKHNQQNKVVKRGLAASPLKFKVTLRIRSLMQSGAYVRIYSDGTVLLSYGGVEMGQGLHTKMLQVCSRVLNIDVSKIHIFDSSTADVANTPPCAASTGSDLNGPAVMDACSQIIARLKPIKEKNPGGKWEDWIKAAYEDQVSLSAYAHFGDGNTSLTLDNPLEGNAGGYFMYGAGSTEVEVDCQTGEVRVLAVDIVMDLGESLNPAIDFGQIEGAFLQGLGLVTTEQLLVSSCNGRMLTSGPGTYKIPTAADIPKDFNIYLLPHSSTSPTSACYSSKGVGEPALLLAMSVPVAVREAVASYRADRGDAGWFHLDPPLTVDKVRMAARDEYCRRAEEEKAANRVDKIAVEI